MERGREDHPRGSRRRRRRWKVGNFITAYFISPFFSFFFPSASSYIPEEAFHRASYYQITCDFQTFLNLSITAREEANISNKGIIIGKAFDFIRALWVVYTNVCVCVYVWTMLRMSYDSKKCTLVVSSFFFRYIGWTMNSNRIKSRLDFVYNPNRFEVIQRTHVFEEKKNYKSTHVLRVNQTLGSISDVCPEGKKKKR